MLRCKLCNKKLNKMLKEMYICRCSDYYCSIHKLEHNCTFDYKELFIQQNKDLIEVKKEKIEKI